MHDSTTVHVTFDVGESLKYLIIIGDDEVLASYSDDGRLPCGPDH